VHAKHRDSVRSILRHSFPRKGAGTALQAVLARVPPSDKNTTNLVLHTLKLLGPLSKENVKPGSSNSNASGSHEGEYKFFRRACGGCGKSEQLSSEGVSSLKQCSKCGVARYCSRACQMNVSSAFCPFGLTISPHLFSAGLEVTQACLQASSCLTNHVLCHDLWLFRTTQRVGSCSGDVGSGARGQWCDWYTLKFNYVRLGFPKLSNFKCTISFPFTKVDGLQLAADLIG
jgi:hypothetical protein